MNSVSEIQTPAGTLRCRQISNAMVYRVGYPPDPWTWTPWEYADSGRFDGRWDDPDGIWRTLYVGSSLLACYLEVLARFRADPAVVNELAAIEDDEEYPTVAAGTLSRAGGRYRAERARCPDAGAGAAVVEVRRSQGAGHP